MMMKRLVVSFLLALAVVPVTDPAEAQGIGGALKKRADEARRKAEEAAARKVAGDSAKSQAAGAAAKPATAPAPASVPSQAPAPPTATAPKTDVKVWENYDFVPGSKVLFYTDFSEDRVGNFARGLKYVSGPAEVVERDGAKVLRSTARSTLLVPIGRTLPQRFTL
jgi:hypothetical protein